MMVADIPREHGWLIQRTTTNVLMKEADEREAALYDGQLFVLASFELHSLMRSLHVALCSFAPDIA